MSAEERFDQWAIVEVMGHNRFIGRVTEQVIAGTGFVRVDIPSHGKDREFTKILSTGSIYAITPVSEDIARSMAGRVRQEPVHPYELTLTADALLSDEGEDGI